MSVEKPFVIVSQTAFLFYLVGVDCYICEE